MLVVGLGALGPLWALLPASWPGYVFGRGERAKLLEGPPILPLLSALLKVLEPCETRDGLGQLSSTGNRHVPLASGIFMVIEAVCGSS